MKRKLWLALLVSFIIVLPVAVHGQIYEDNSDDNEISSESARENDRIRNGKAKRDKLWNWDQFYVGGIPGFSISNNFASVDVATEAGYFVVPDRLALGVRLSYEYYRDRILEFSLNNFGGGPVARGYIWDGLFAQVEYEVLSVGNFPLRVFGSSQDGDRRFNSDALLIGGGYHNNFNGGVGFYIAVLYNVLDDNDLFEYANPVFRFGVTYNFGGR